MSVRVVPLAAVTDDDVARWRDLAGRAAEPNPYLEPEYLVNIAPAWPSSAEVLLAAVEDGGAWLAVLAFTLDKLTLARVTMPVVKVPGAFLREATGRQHLLVDRADPARVLGELADGLRAAGLPGVIEFGFMPADGPLAGALHAWVAERRLRRVELETEANAYAAPVRASVAGPQPEPVGSLVRGGQLSAKRRSHLRRSAKAIEADLGAPLKHVGRTDDRAAVEDFIELQAAGWKGDAESGGRAIASVPGYRDAFFAMTDALRVQGRLRVDALEASGRAVHIALAMRARGGGWFALLDAFDESLGAHSPGNLGRLAVLNALRDGHPAEAFDPCVIAANPTVASLYPDSRDFAYVIVGHGSATSRARLAGAAALRSARAWGSA